MLDKLISLRKELHKHPEVSGKEKDTATRIKNFLLENTSARIVNNIGGHGLAAVFDFPGKGPAVMIRCELDALPITEINDFPHTSVSPSVSHKCGHDGHMAIVAGIACWLTEQNFKNGRVILLFQPAEETGQGAAAVLRDPKFEELAADYMFALHNIPGADLHKIITVNEHFSASVQSLAIYLQGKESHASEPENGINPAKAVSELISEFSKMNVADLSKENFALLTPVHIKMGQPAYGISAGEAELHYTLRTWNEGEMNALKEQIFKLTEAITRKQNLKYYSQIFDQFPATRNHQYCNSLIRKAAELNGFQVEERSTPFKFGEDFGWFSQRGKAAMFGLGAGKNSPALHNPDYDFPEELLETGISMFKQIICEILS